MIRELTDVAHSRRRIVERREGNRRNLNLRVRLLDSLRRDSYALSMRVRILRTLKQLAPSVLWKTG